MTCHHCASLAITCCYTEQHILVHDVQHCMR